MLKILLIEESSESFEIHYFLTQTVVAKIWMSQIGYSKKHVLFRKFKYIIHGWHMAKIRKFLHKTWEQANVLPVSACIPDCLNKQKIILILIFYSRLPLLVSLKQGITIKSKRTRRKLCFPLSSWQNCH